LAATTYESLITAPPISETAELIDAAKREFAAISEVQQCYCVTGEADFVLVVVVPMMTAYEALTRRLFFDTNNVKRFHTFVAMDRVKGTVNLARSRRS
jgi:Lrp/AsnC family leucine-responsive transcriptional regulator